MSADDRNQESGLRLALLCGCLACTWPAAAADDDQPDMAFLEYLGSWEESDEDWLVLDDGVLEMAKEEKRSDPAPGGEESTEQHNES